VAQRTDDIMSDQTTAQDPEQIRREIAATRADMDRTLAELEDRVSPTRIRERQTQKLQSRWQETRERVMGASDDGPSARDRLMGSAHDAQEAVQHAPERMEEVTRGNPLAVGLIAFGVGAVAGSLLPSTGAERRVATELRNEFEEPVREQLQGAGQEIKGELQEHAQQAVEETKQTAQQAAERTQQEAKGSAEQVKQHAQDSAQTVRDEG
jgi:gas vesicle protein